MDFHLLQMQFRFILSMVLAIWILPKPSEAGQCEDCIFYCENCSFGLARISLTDFKWYKHCDHNESECRMGK